MPAEQQAEEMPEKSLTEAVDSANKADPANKVDGPPNKRGGRAAEVMARTTPEFLQEPDKPTAVKPSRRRPGRQQQEEQQKEQQGEQAFPSGSPSGNGASVAGARLPPTTGDAPAPPPALGKANSSSWFTVPPMGAQDLAMPSAQDQPQGESRASTRVDLQSVGQDADEEAIPLCIKLWQSLQTLPPGPFPLGAVMCTLLLATGMLMCAYSAIKVQTMMAPLIPVFEAFAFIRKVAQMALFFKFTFPVAFVFSLLVIWRGMHTRDLFVGREGLHKRAYARLKQSANDGRVVHRGLAQKKACVKDDFHHEITNTTNYAYLYTLTTAALSIAMVISTLLIVLCSAIFFTAFVYPVPSDEVCRLTVDLIQSDLLDESKTAAIAANLTAQGRMSADAALDNKRGQFNVTEELAVYDMRGVNHLIPGCDVAMLMRGCGLLATQVCYRLPGMYASRLEPWTTRALVAT